VLITACQALELLSSEPPPAIAFHYTGDEHCARLATLLRDLPCVGIAVSSTPVDGPACDLHLTSARNPPRPWVQADPDQVRHEIDWHPEAAVSLVQLLRLSSRLSPRDGLVAESLAYSALQGSTAFTPRANGDGGEPVLVRRSARELTITLNRPHVHNAFNAASRDALVEALHVALADPAIARVTLRGNGPSFCSGGDLAEFGTSKDPARAHVIRTTRSVAALLTEVGPRVTAHLHGACVGAGIELAAFAGHVTVAPSTMIRLPELGMGLIPGAGGTVSLPARIGRQRTAYLAVSGQTIDAATALTWGLADSP
jgi:hypothetical protein